MEFAEVPIGHGYEAGCVRCHPEASRPERVFLPAEQVAEQVARIASEWERAVAGPGPNVAFVGAEPFSHPELPGLVAGAVSAGFERVRLRTDAGALAAGSNATGVLSAGVHHLEVELLGAGSDTHDRLTGRNGLFEAARSGVSAYRSAADAMTLPVAITGLVRVCRHNAAELATIVSTLAAWGAVSVELIVGAGYRPDAAVVAGAAQTAVVNGVWLHGDAVELPGIAPWKRSAL